MQCTAFRQFKKNTLTGFADIEVAGLIIRDCPVHQLDGRRWVSMPARPVLDFRGAPVVMENGKVKYAELISFSTRDVRDRFVQAALAAIDAFCGERAEDHQERARQAVLTFEARRKNASNPVAGRRR